jgi:Bacterial SH3 domain
MATWISFSFGGRPGRASINRHLKGLLRAYEPPLERVNRQGGMIYESPDTQSRVLSSLPPGHQVSLIGSVGGWAHVVVNGIDGYMKTSQLQ